MNAGPDTLYEGLAREKVARVDEVCDRFEAAWKAVGPGQDFPDPRLFLSGFENAERAVLAQELILLDRAYRQQRGEQTQATDYLGLCAQYDQRLAVDDPTRDQSTPDPTAPIQSAVRIPGFEIEAVLGTGGMGIVYKARQPALDRYVALKVLRSSSLEDEEHRQRFLQEARAAAQLQHPNLVQVYEIGETGGEQGTKAMPYFAMEYVAGGNLAHYLQSGSPSQGEAAQLVETLARAVQHAHDHGIIHRDLKPANILLQQTDKETRRQGDKEIAGNASRSLSPCLLVSLSPKIADFGLAKRLDNDRTAWTQEGVLLGTPSYMAPEQTETSRASIGPETDVYGLGAILYELLTGRPPFRAETVLATVLQVRDQEPVAVDRLQPTVPRDLQTICLKCLEKDRHKRFATAAALGDDLRRFLDGRPIHARSIGSVERMVKWAKRRPAIAALIASVLLVAVLGFAGILWQFGKTVSALDQSRKANEATQAQLYLNQIALAQHELLAHQVNQAEHHLDEIPAAQRGWEWHYLKGLCRTSLLTLRGHRSELQCVTYSKDGKLLASGSGEWSSGRNGELFVWDAQSGKILWKLGRDINTVYTVVFHPDNTRLAAAGFDGKIRLWNARTGERLRELSGHTGTVNGLAFSPDGRWLVSASSDQTVRLWDVASGRRLRTWTHHRTSVWAIAFSPDGRYFASCDRNGVAHLWDPQSLTPVRSFSNRGDLRAVAFSPDGTWLALTGYSSGMILWDLARQDSKPIVRIPNSSAILDVSFFPDGRMVWTSTDGSIKIQDLRTGMDLLVLEGHDGWARSVSVSPDGRTVATGGSDTTIRLWDATKQQEPSTVLEDNPALILELCYEPDGKLLATGNLRDTTKIWDVTTRKALQAQAPRSNVSAAAIHPGGRFWACVGEDKVLRILDRNEKTNVWSKQLTSWPVTSVAYSSDGRYLAWGGADGLVRLLSAVNGAEIRTIGSEESAITGLAFHPEGKLLAGAAKDRSIQIWAVTTGKKVAQLGASGRNQLPEPEATPDRTPPAAITRLAYSPDGRRLAVASLPRPLEIWDVQAGRVALILNWESEGATCAAWSPDGKRLAGARGRIVKIWDVSERAQDAQRLAPADPLAWHAIELQHCRSRQDLFGVVYHLSRMLDADPASIGLHEQRGIARVFLALDQHGSWEDSAQDFAKAIELGTESAATWYRLATVALVQDNKDRYRKTCTEMMARFGDSKDPYTTNMMAWICTIRDGSVDKADSLVELAGRAIARSPREHDYLNTHAAALYRAGKYREAQQRLMEAVQVLNQEGSIADCLYLAMVHHRLGEANEARKWLEKAVQQLDRSGNYHLPGAAVPMEWEHRLLIGLLRSEATKLLTGSSP